MKLATVIAILLFHKHGESTMEPYIFGGDYAPVEKFPYSAFVEIRCIGRKWVCGASVVNQKVILTAAHCMSECVTDPSWNITVLAGHEELEMAIRRSAASYIMHENFVEKTHKSDIALIGLKEDLPLNKYIERVIIRKRFSENDLESPSNVAGWGITNREDRKMSRVLKYVGQKLISSSKCNMYLTNMQPGTICGTALDYKEADDEDTYDRPAAGDSGCALVTKRNEQIGIVSSHEVAMPNVVIYTNVTYFYNWIKINSKKLFCQK